MSVWARQRCSGMREERDGAEVRAARGSSSTALTLGTRTSTASSLSTAGRSGPTTSRCECASRFAIDIHEYAFSLYVVCK